MITRSVRTNSVGVPLLWLNSTDFFSGFAYEDHVMDSQQWTVLTAKKTKEEAAMSESGQRSRPWPGLEQQRMTDYYDEEA